MVGISRVFMGCCTLTLVVLVLFFITVNVVIEENENDMKVSYKQVSQEENW